MEIPGRQQINVHELVARLVQSCRIHEDSTTDPNLLCDRFNGSRAEVNGQLLLTGKSRHLRCCTLEKPVTCCINFLLTPYEIFRLKKKKKEKQKDFGFSVIYV